MNKKTVALMLSVSMILSGVGAGNMPYRAKAENTGSTTVVKTGTGSSIASPEISENPSDTAEEVTAAPVSTAAVTQVPDETAIPGEPESPKPSDASGEETTKPSTTPAVTQIPDVAETPAQTDKPGITEAPAGTTTPSAVATTTPSAVTTTTPSALAVGDQFSAGNFIYSVVTAADGIAKPAVKVRGLSEAGKTKTSITIPATITWQGVTYLVNGINQRSFRNNTKLTSVKIGKNVTYIGKSAFRGMTSLTSVSIGSGVTTIKKLAFGGCTSLRKVAIPAKTNLIGEKAFQNCKKLKAVVVNSRKITTIKSNAFRYVKSGCYAVVPSGKKTLYRTLLVKAKASAIKIYVY